MENNCVTLETAKKLKAAGFPQKTAVVWESPGTSGRRKLSFLRDIRPLYADLSAPTAQEIADQLHWRDVGIGFLNVTKHPDGWKARYFTGVDKGSGIIYSTMAEALAALYLKLAESSIIKE